MAIIRFLENDLLSELGENILNDENRLVDRVGLFSKRNKKSNEEFDLSKRETLGKIRDASIGGLGAYFVGTGLFHSPEAQASIDKKETEKIRRHEPNVSQEQRKRNALHVTDEERRLFEEHLPPGIFECPDVWVKRLFLHAQKIKQYDQAERRINAIGEILGEGVFKSTRELEPAVYLVKKKLELVGDGSLISVSIMPENLKQENPALYHFASGIGYYFDAYINHNRHNRFGIIGEKKAEEEFVYSLFNTVNQNYTTAISQGNEFLNGDLATKSRMANSLVSDLRNMTGANSNSLDPNNAHFRRLTAGWSSHFLANSIVRKNKSKMNDFAKLTYEQIEKPMDHLNKFDMRHKDISYV